MENPKNQWRFRSLGRSSISMGHFFSNPISSSFSMAMSNNQMVTGISGHNCTFLLDGSQQFPIQFHPISSSHHGTIHSPPWPLGVLLAPPGNGVSSCPSTAEQWSQVRRCAAPGGCLVWWFSMAMRWKRWSKQIDMTMIWLWYTWN